MRDKKHLSNTIIRNLALLVPLIMFALGITLLFTWDKGFKITALQEESVAEPVSEAPAARSETGKVRPAAFADRFYPAEEKELYGMVEALLHKRQPLGLPDCRSVLVPHAGYVYSGEVAAAGFREVGRFNRVFIMAANHNGEAKFSGVSIPDATHYAIPGHEIPLAAAADELLNDPLFISEPLAHTMHMIEIELPFLQALQQKGKEPGFAIVPLILGRLDREEIGHLAAVLDSYDDGQTLFVFSADLSHFYPASKARSLDAQTIQAVMSMDDQALDNATTDGNHVLLTMLELAEINGWEPTMLQYKNSGDVSGDLTRVVGYAAIAFHKPIELSTAEQDELLRLARSAIAEHLTKDKSPGIGNDAGLLHPILQVPRGVFVTLKKNGRLRGCIGSLLPGDSLITEVQDCAIKAATLDRRFTPVTREELDELTLSISVLSYPRQVKVAGPKEYPQVIRPGRDGIILLHQGRSSTYLPQVWNDLPEPVAFLSRLCEKQGATADCWQDAETKIYRYEAFEFGEKTGNAM